MSHLQHCYILGYKGVANTTITIFATHLHLLREGNLNKSMIGPLLCILKLLRKLKATLAIKAEIKTLYMVLGYWLSLWTCVVLHYLKSLLKCWIMYESALLNCSPMKILPDFIQFSLKQGIKVCNPFCNLIIWKWKILYKTPPELTSIWISFEQQMQILILENVQAEWIVESNLHYSMTFHLHTSVLEV